MELSGTTPAGPRTPGVGTPGSSRADPSGSVRPEACSPVSRGSVGGGWRRRWTCLLAGLAGLTVLASVASISPAAQTPTGGTCGPLSYVDPPADSFDPGLQLSASGGADDLNITSYSISSEPGERSDQGRAVVTMTLAAPPTGHSGHAVFYNVAWLTPDGKNHWAGMRLDAKEKATQPPSPAPSTGITET
ncbi:MAG: hypothetical protein LC772_11805, partial [Chloroflexi bacterium]|nr:hypothetical protein [Chloroflexota bacterium]